MKIPKKINILGTIYKIKFANSVPKYLKKYGIESEHNEDCEGMVGYASCLFNIIVLNKNLSKDSQESVFIHEIIEVINDTLALHLKHDNIDRLEAGIYQTLKCNGLLNESKN